MVQDTAAESKKFVGKCALHLEDQPDKTQAITDFLEQGLGVDITKASTPSEAFEALRSRKFDLLILDIRIPDGDTTQEGEPLDWTRYGVYFLEQLRNGKIDSPTPANVPVLILTCVVSTQTVDGLAELGSTADGTYRYLAKPVRLAHVMEAVVDLLRPSKNNFGI